MPDLPGLKDFGGTVRHSGDYGSGLDWQEFQTRRVKR
jgi:hypothetical protein